MAYRPDPRQAGIRLEDTAAVSAFTTWAIWAEAFAGCARAPTAVPHGPQQHYASTQFEALNELGYGTAENVAVPGRVPGRGVGGGAAALRGRSP